MIDGIAATARTGKEGGFRDGGPPPDVEDRIVILIDEGLLVQRCARPRQLCAHKSRAHRNGGSGVVAKADVKTKNNEGKTALMLATEVGHDETVWELTQADAGN